MAKTLDRGLENREIVLDILTEVLEQGCFCPPCTEQACRSIQYLGQGGPFLYHTRCGRNTGIPDTD